MSFADSWYRASCALLLLTLHFSMFSFYRPLSFSLSLLLSLSLSLSLSLPPSFSLWLQDTCHLMPFTKYSLLDHSYFFTISFHSSYKIHQLFTDYLLRLPSSELLEKHLFRSRANRRLVLMRCTPLQSIIQQKRLCIIPAARPHSSQMFTGPRLSALVKPDDGKPQTPNYLPLYLCIYIYYNNINKYEYLFVCLSI